MSGCPWPGPFHPHFFNFQFWDIISAPAPAPDPAAAAHRADPADLIAGIVAVILNLIIPDDAPERDDVVHSTSPAPGYVDSQPGLPMLGKSTDVEKTAGMEDEDYKARVEPSEGVSGVSSGVQARTTVLEA